tara:strand:+ start:3591 stop:6386 length:2796 start_codon:yes stop_codon:yes gene_type:complete
MASAGQEVELLSSGMKADSADKGTFYQNLRFRRGEWSTRPGFGQVAQFDSTMSLQTEDKSTQYGYGEPLGSYSFVTNFGHTQLLTLLPLRAFTGDTEMGNLGVWIDGVAVSIYDYTSDSRWEEVLCRHTSKITDDLFPVRDMKGVYQTSRDADFSDWEYQGSSNWFFEEFNDAVYFGSPEVGMFVYVPADFSSPRRQQTEGAADYSFIRGYGESAVVKRVSASEGSEYRSFSYFDRATYPQPVDVCSWQNRLVMASGRDLYFSDEGRPAAIISTNVVSVPGDSEIVAIERSRDGVLVFFKNSVWLYSPSRGLLSNAGRSVRMCDGVGCISSQCVVAADDGVFWADRNGVYLSSGGLTYKRISDDIFPFFQSFLSNPLSSYWTDQGHTDLSGESPTTLYSVVDAGRMTLSFDNVDRHLFFVCPDLGISFVFSDGIWTVWNFESNAEAAVESGVGVARNLRSPQIVCADESVFLVGWDLYTPNDPTLVAGTGAADARNSPMGSYFISVLGRGGALDRSVESFEDMRLCSGSYRTEQVTAAPESGYTLGGDVYIGEPVYPRQVDYPLPSGATKSNVVLVPVYLAPNSTLAGLSIHPGGIDQFRLDFKFDNTHWKPASFSHNVTWPSVLELIFPPERTAMMKCWGADGASAVVNLSEASVYDSGGSRSAVGNEIRLRFDGNNAAVPPATNVSAPNLNVTSNWKNLLFYIPFERLNAAADTMSFGIDVDYATARFVYPHVGLPGTMFRFTIHHWLYAAPSSKHSRDDVAQPVDWVALPGAVTVGGGQALLRALYLRVTSNSSALFAVRGASTFGLLNFLLSGDSRRWAAQIIDYTGGAVQSIVNKNSIRTRMQASSVMKDVTFDGDATWGTKTNSSHGNVLMGDDPVNDIAVSDAVRGSELRAMMFGHVRNRAERIGLSSVSMMYRLLGGRRRRGR